MKWFPGPDYRIWVSSLERQHRDADGDEPPIGFARHFEDVYRLRVMDSSLDIIFLPERCGPVHSFGAGDDPAATNARRAGASMLIDARFVVTPNGSRHGELELIARPVSSHPEGAPPGAPPPEVPVFYVTPEHYEGYLDELDLLSRQPMGRPHVEAHEEEWWSYASQYPLGPLRSTMAHLTVIRFVDETILGSPHLTNAERHWIGR